MLKSYYNPTMKLDLKSIFQESDDPKDIGEVFNGSTEPKEEALPEKEEDVVENEEEQDVDKFLVISTYGELLDVAMQIQKEGKRVILCITDAEHKKIGDGIVPKEDNWHDCIGKGYIWVVDGCEHASLQDWLREQGEQVVGTNQTMSEDENDRDKGQELFKKAGFKQPESVSFEGDTAFDDAIEYIQSKT